MKGNSHPLPGAISILERLVATGRYRMAMLNNESMPLNYYRIHRFDLPRFFSAFFSSCFVRVRKPEPLIFETALRIWQCAPDETLFIDDRMENVEGARAVGLNAVYVSESQPLEQGLTEAGVQFGARQTERAANSPQGNE